MTNYIRATKNTEIFYLYPALSTDEIMNDGVQCLEVRNLANVYAFPIRSAGHGVVIAMESVIAYINKSPGKLKEIHKELQQKYEENTFYSTGISETTLAIELIGLHRVVALKIRDYWRSGQKIIFPNNVNINQPRK